MFLIRLDEELHKHLKAAVLAFVGGTHQRGDKNAGNKNAKMIVGSTCELQMRCKMAYFNNINGISNFKYIQILNTRISGRYAPLILAPPESSSLEPCTFDYLIIYFFNYLII